MAIAASVLLFFAAAGLILSGVLPTGPSYALAFLTLVIAGLVLCGKIGSKYRRIVLTCVASTVLTLVVYLGTGPLWYYVPAYAPAAKRTLSIEVGQQIEGEAEGRKAPEQDVAEVVGEAASLWCKRFPGKGEPDVQISVTLRGRAGGNSYVPWQGSSNSRWIFTSLDAAAQVEVRPKGKPSLAAAVELHEGGHPKYHGTFDDRFNVYELGHAVRVLLGRALGTEPLMAAYVNRYDTHSPSGLERALAEIGGKKEVAFLKRVEQHPIPNSLPISDVFAFCANEDGEALLLTLAASPRDETRRSLARALKNFKSAASAEVLLKLLADPNPSCRREAAFSLCRRSIKSAEPALIEALDQESGDYVAQWAEKVRFDVGPHEIEQIIGALRDCGGQPSIAHLSGVSGAFTRGRITHGEWPSGSSEVPNLCADAIRTIQARLAEGTAMGRLPEVKKLK